MTWLVTQLWFLLLLAFVAGALVVGIVARLFLPHVNDLDLDPSERTN